MASADLSVFCVDDNFLLVPGSVKSRTGRAVPGVEDRCTYTKEKKGALGSGAHPTRDVRHTRKLSWGRTGMNHHVYNVPAG